MTDKLLSVQQVAERMQVHPATVRRLIKRGALEKVATESTRLIRITEEAFNRFTQGAK